jgi:hypothetical protein
MLSVIVHVRTACMLMLAAAALGRVRVSLPVMTCSRAVAVTVSVIADCVARLTNHQAGAHVLDAGRSTWEPFV